MASTKWLRHLSLVCCASEFYLTVVVAHVCFIEKKLNPSTNTLQWAVPRVERCFCQGLVALGVFKAPACSTLKEDDTELWFIDDPIPLLNRKNWVPAILDELLQRDECWKATTATSTTAPSLAATEASTNTKSNLAVIAVRYQQDEDNVSRAAATEKSTSSVDIVQTTIHRATTELTEVLQVCTDKLGMENGDIANESISASSEVPHDGYGYVYQARLNGALSWRTTLTRRDWIQADIGYQTNITGVITQGDGGVGGHANWVKALMVSTFLKSTDDVEVFVEDDNGQSKIFQANTDRYTEAMLMFPEPTFARIVRILCLDSLTEYIQMRFEILGCKYSN